MEDDKCFLPSLVQLFIKFQQKTFKNIHCSAMWEQISYWL